MKRIIIQMPDEGNPQFLALMAELRRLPRIQIEEQALDPRDIGIQIDKLRGLSDGWLNGQGLAPDSKGIDWLARAFEEHWPDNALYPWICMTEEGQVEAEWIFEGFNASLEINLGQKTGYWHLLNLKTEKFDERELDLYHFEKNQIQSIQPLRPPPQPLPPRGRGF